MTPAMIAALASGRAMLTCLYQIDLPSGTRRLLLGSSEVSWDGDLFVGRDPTFGFIDAPDDISEDMGGEVPNTSFTLVQAPGADPDDIASADVQMSRYRQWLAVLALDGSKKVTLVPDPEQLFEGFIDQPTINLDRKRKEIEYTVISGFDYFFEDSEGERLNSQFHKSIWPGETGLDNVTGITRKIYWGTNAPPGAVGGTSSIYGGGGATGGYGYQPRMPSP